MATNSPAPLTELDKYFALALELETRVTELERYHAQRAEFASLDQALRAERRQLNEVIYDAAGSTDNLATELERLDRSIKLNTASSEALAGRIDEREKYLWERTPLAIATFQRLREYVVGAVLEACRQKVKALFTEDMAVGLETGEGIKVLIVADEHIDAIATVMPPVRAISQLRLPSVNWQMQQPLDAEPPPVWNSLVRAFTPAEWQARRVELIDCVIRAAKSLCEAGKALVVAAAPYAGDCPRFVCEPEPELVPESQSHPEWNEDLNRLSPSDRMRALAKEAGKEWESLSETDRAILVRSETDNQSYLKEARPWAEAPSPTEPQGAQP